MQGVYHTAVRLWKCNPYLHIVTSAKFEIVFLKIQSKFLTKNSGKIVYFVRSISMLVKSSIMSRLVIILVCPIFHSFAFLHWNVEIKRWSDLKELDGLLTRYDLTGIGIIWYALISCLTAIDLFWHYGWFIKCIALANFLKFNDKSW